MRLRRFAVLSLFLAVAGSAASASDSVQLHSGLWRGRVVTYQVSHGQPRLEGDILLDHIQQSPLPVSGEGATTSYLSYLWPKVGSVYQIPYVIDPASGGVSNINAAIAQSNATFPGVLQWVAHTTETDYVNINLNSGDFSGVCESAVGRIGGEQMLTGSAACAVSTLLHEMGHTVGLYHEQSRSDRDAYVSVNYNNVIKGSRANFDKVTDNVQNLTLYDYASVMGYIPFAFSRNGGPTLESIPPGMPLSNLVGYSAGDVDATKRLYSAAPTAVTVTSNPPGLQVIVDGATVTTPQVFTWSLNSTHSVDIPSGSQTLAGLAYTYGRWNDSTAASHTITVLPGNGELPFPPTSPAVTVYSANFIKLVPYVTAIFPANTGSVTAAPSPQAYPPASGLFYPARQQVTLTATPNSGQNFYAFINSPFYLPGGISANPKTFYVMDDGTTINTTVYFTTSPVYTVTTNPVPSNIGVLVDNGFWYAPKSFALPYDSTWTSGSSHTLNLDSPQYPWSINTRYAYSSWSDAGAQSHSVTLPATTTSYTASLTPQFYVTDYTNQFCAGSISVTPSSSDGYYNSGQILTFDQTTSTGWTFTGWLYDLNGTGDPQNLTVADEVLAVADYNTSPVQLSLTSLSPAAAVAGAATQTLTMKGTGFSSSSTIVFVNGVFRPSTFVDANTLTLSLTAADLATPGAIQIFVESFPSGASCAAFAATPFFVASAPLVKPTPASLSFSPQVVATASASKAITLKNTGVSTVTLNALSASGNFAQTNTCGSSLAAGASCTVNVTFTPVTSGAITGAITVSDSSPDSPQVIALTGTGQTPLTIAPATLSFGAVTVGHTSPAKTVTLTNNQTKTLNFSFSASGNYTAVGGGTPPCSTTLAAKAKCSISVTFKPTANGSINGAVTISHDAVFTPQEVALTGSGSGGASSPLTFTPATLTFPSQVVGTGASRNVTVKNVSTASLTISSLTASGNYAAVGSGAKPCNGLLAAGATCTMSVTFTPSLNGTIKGAVVVTDTAPVNQQVLNVSGTAVLPVSLSPTSLTFAAQTVGTASASQTVTLTNNQSTTLTITAITGSGDYTAVPGGLSPCGTTVAAKGSCTFTVSFTPSAVGTIVGAATVSHNAAFNPTIVATTGTGQ